MSRKWIAVHLLMHHCSAGSVTSKNCALRTAKPKALPKPEVKPVIKGKSSFFMKSASAGDAENKQETTETKKEEVKGKGSLFTKSASTGSSADNKKNKEGSKNDGKQTSKVIFLLVFIRN